MLPRSSNCATVLALWCGGKSLDSRKVIDTLPYSSSSEYSTESETTSDNEQDDETQHTPNSSPIAKDTIHSDTAITTFSTTISTIKTTDTKATSSTLHTHSLNIPIIQSQHIQRAQRVLLTKLESESSSASSHSSGYSSEQDLHFKSDLQFTRSLPSNIEIKKKVFSQYTASLDTDARHYAPIKITTDRTTNVHRYSSTPTTNKKRKNNTQESISVLFYQLTSIKKLDLASQINVILDEFLTDYPQYEMKMKGKRLPYKYLFRNDIIGNLIFGWNLGIQKTNSTLITRCVQSLRKFAHRNEFRAPFINKHGIRLIDETLSIASLEAQTNAFSHNNMHSDTMMKRSTFAHILAVLKLISDICKADNMDPELWRSSKIHHKVLNTMKRDYDEEQITKACKHTIMSLLDVSYELAQDMIHKDHIHDMIDSFLKTTATEYFKDTHRLIHKISLRKQDSQMLRKQPLFIHNSSDKSNTSITKQQIKHQKTKNLLQLEHDAISVRVSHNDNKLNINKTLTTEEHIDNRESSAYLSDDEEDEYETGTDLETELESEWEADEEDDKSHVSSYDESQSNDSNVDMPLDPHMRSIASIKYVHNVTSDDAASDKTNICYGEESEDSILSLAEYDAIVEEMQKKTALEEEYDEEEKAHIAASHKTVPDVPKWNDIRIHSVNIDEEAMADMEIELESHQLLYINSLFHILYKIITLKRSYKDIQIRIGTTAKKTTGNTFMEMLTKRRNRDRAMSGDTFGELSQKDVACMSDSETIYRKTNLKQFNRKKNKLLESFFASLSFKNLFKLLKYYQLNSLETCTLFDFGSNSQIDYEAYKFSAQKSDDSAMKNTDMVSIQKLACKILRKLLSYSQIITDKLLIDDKLDVIGILVTLLFRNPSNIDLIIYILDIFSKITKDNDDIRDLLLTPEHFDKLLRALDPWWMLFIHSTKALVDALEKKPIEEKKTEPLLHLQLFHSVSKVLSVESIGVAEKRDTLADESELHIEVTIAMLKFFKLLSCTNALDIVEYGINDRIVVLLDYYLNISLKYDPYEVKQDNNLDLEIDYAFVFSHDKHQQCLSLCFECIQTLASDINMLLEFVFDGTLEKLVIICWSFRNHAEMMRKCCDVINKLLKLQHARKQIGDQKILQPLIHIVEHIFRRSLLRELYPPKLMIAYELFADIYDNHIDEDDDEEEYEADGSSEYEDGEEYEEGEEYEDEKVEYLESEDTTSDDELEEANNTSRAFGKYSALGKSSPAAQHTHFHLRYLKDIFNVLVNISYVDKLCVDIIESKIMLLLIECIANKALRIHDHMMISLVASDLLQHLTKNKNGAQALINSKRFQIVKYIVDAISNNISNRGVVLKYLRTLMDLKGANRKQLMQQLHDNECVGFLKKVGFQYHELININDVIGNV